MYLKKNLMNLPAVIVIIVQNLFEQLRYCRALAAAHSFCFSAQNLIVLIFPK